MRPVTSTILSQRCQRAFAGCSRPLSLADATGCPITAWARQGDGTPSRRSRGGTSGRRSTESPGRGDRHGHLPARTTGGTPRAAPLDGEAARGRPPSWRAPDWHRESVRSPAVRRTRTARDQRSARCGEKRVDGGPPGEGRPGRFPHGGFAGPFAIEQTLSRIGGCCAVRRTATVDARPSAAPGRLRFGRDAGIIRLSPA